MRDPGPLRLICDEVSPFLDYVAEDGSVLDVEVAFRCQKSKGHRGDHRIVLDWSRDPFLLAVSPWKGGGE
jgi:hypothetical protein